MSNLPLSPTFSLRFFLNPVAFPPLKTWKLIPQRISLNNSTKKFGRQECAKFKEPSSWRLFYRCQAINEWTNEWTIGWSNEWHLNLKTQLQEIHKFAHWHNLFLGVDWCHWNSWTAVAFHHSYHNCTDHRPCGTFTFWLDPCFFQGKGNVYKQNWKRVTGGKQNGCAKWKKTRPTFKVAVSPCVCMLE